MANPSEQGPSDLEPALPLHPTQANATRYIPTLPAPVRSIVSDASSSWTPSRADGSRS